MGTRTGQTSVEVVADVAKFGSELQTGLNKALDKVKVDGSKVGKKLASDIDGGVKQAEKSLMRLDSIPVGDKLAKSVSDGVDKATAAVKKLDDLPIGDGIAAGSEKAKTSLKGIGDEADKVSEKVKQNSKKTEDSISAPVEKGSEKAKTSLKGIGKTAGEAANDAKEGFDKLEGALAGVGLVAGVALGEGIAEGLKRTQLTGLLVAQIGAAPAQAGRIGKLSGEIYAENFGENIEEVNSALKAAFQNGLADVNKQTDASVKQVTERLLTVSQVLEEDTSRTANAIQQLLRTGLVKNTEEAMDLLVAATQKGVNKSDDLLDTVNEYSTQFRNLGLTGPQALGLLSQAIQGGARDSDTAADALKEFAIRAVDGSALSAQGFKNLGLKAQDFTKTFAKGGDAARDALGIVLDRLRAITDPVKRNATAVALFGTKAEDLGQALFDMDLDTATDQFKTLKGSTDAAADSIGNNAGAKLAAFGRQLQGQLIGTLVEVGTHIMENKDAYAVLGGVVTGLVGIIGGLNVATKVWKATQTAITVITKGWALANKILSISLLGTPLGWILLAVGALVGAFILAYTKSETFRNAVQTALKAVGQAGIWLWNNALKPAFNGIVAAVKWVGDAAVWLWQNAIQPAWTAISNAAVWLWTNAIQPAFSGIVTGAKWVGNAIAWLWTNIISPYFTAWATIAKWVWSNIIQPAWSAIVAATQVLGKIFAWLYSVIQPPLAAVASLVFWLWKQVFLVAWEGIKAAFQVQAAIIEWWWNTFVSPIFKAVGALALWLWKNAIMPAFNAIKQILINLGVSFGIVWTNYLNPFFQKVATVAKWLWTNVISPTFNLIKNHIVTQIKNAVAAATLVAGFVSKVSANFTNLVNSVRSRMESAAAIVKGFPSKIVSAIGNLGSLLYKAGQNVIQGLINGISSKLGALRDKAASAAKAIRNLFPFSPAKEGPLSGGGSPDIAGGKIATMIAAGMERNTPKLVDAARSMAAATLSGGSRGLDFAGQGILRSAIGAAGSGAVTAAAPTGGGITFAPGAINVTFSGAVPTEREAYQTGQAVGAGIAQTLSNRNVHNTVRQL